MVNPLAAVLGPVGGLAACACCLNLAAIWAAVLGPVGGLAACACCLLLAAIWGLFATTIALAVVTKQWVDAVKNVYTISGGVQMVFSHA
ncbi:unnamed protein product [Rotaria magnacalcarata]|nr:unnamed protein product [Rotaria magnacalcarata]